MALSPKMKYMYVIQALFQGEEVGLFIASADISASCSFNFKEWDRFIKAINRVAKPDIFLNRGGKLELVK